MESNPEEENPCFSAFQRELESHPVFQFIEDPLLSLAIRPIYQLKRRLPPIELLLRAKAFGYQIQEMFFEAKTAEDLHTEFQELSLVQKTLCGKFINEGELFFRCIDCELLMSANAWTLFCVDCFDKSKHQHEGHRIQASHIEEGEGVCDCGDADIIKSEGFCPDHNTKKVSVEELLQKFPKDILERFTFILKKAFYGVFALYEIARKCEDFFLSGDLHIFADFLLNEVFVFCIDCYSEIDSSFITILELVFKSPFEEPYKSLWHDCKDIRDETNPKEVDITQPKVCSCLILENFLRISNIMGTNQQVQFKQIYLDCFSASESKEFYHTLLTKYIHFMFTKNEYESRKRVSAELLGSEFQFFEREDLNLKTLDSGYFQQTIQVVKKAINSLGSTFLEIERLNDIFDQIKTIWKYFIGPRKKTSDRLLKQSTFLKDLLEVLMMFQTKFFYSSTISVGVFDHTVLYSEINCLHGTENCVGELIEQALELICTYPEEEKQEILKSFLSHWLENFQLTKMIVDEKHAQGIQTFNPALERALGFALKTRFGNSISSSKLEKYLEEVLPNTKPGKVATQVIEDVFRTLGLVRYLLIVNNFNGGALWSLYYFIKNLAFETDTSTVQIMAMLVPAEDLFQIMVQNYFSYSEELQNFFKNPRSLIKEDYLKQKISVLQDFLQFLIFVMNDEICFLNIQLQNCTFKREEELDDRSKQVLRKVVINLLLNSFWTDLIQVKNSARLILYLDRYVDEIVPTLTISDESGQKIRLKEEYVSEFDPYLFHRAPALQANIIDTVSSRQKKDKPIDLISGKYYPNAPEHLKTIQKQFFQSDLPDFLSGFLHNFEPETVPLIRPALKLILFNLQVVHECRINPEASLSKLEEKVEKCFMTAEFQEDLNKVLANPDLEDCKLCIQKIQNLIERLKLKAEIISGEISEVKIFEEAKNDEDKKRLAAEKMQKMKEKFAKQRENFSKTNTELIETNQAESPNTIDEKEKICQVCLGDIIETEDQTEYGIPIYVAFTNNFYDTSQEAVFKKQDHSKFSEEDWWPVISSCNHYYHKDCFREVNKNSKKPQNQNRGNYSHPNETNCPMCTTLCNAFLCLNQKTEQKENLEQTENSEQSNENDLYSSLGEDLKSLLKTKAYYIRGVIGTPVIENEAPIALREIFWRAYFYYIHSFSLNKSTRSLQQQSNLHTQFFKALLPEVNAQEKIVLSQSSFLERLYQKININSKDEENNHQINRLLEFQSESLLGEISFDLLISSSSEHTLQEQNDKERVSFQTLLQEYFAFKVVQFACFEQGQNFKTLEDILSYYKKTQSFKDKIASELLYPLQFAILPYSLHKTILTNSTSSLDENGDLLLQSYPLADHLNQLLQALEFNSPFENFIETSLLNLSKLSPEDLQPLTQMVQLNPVASQGSIPRVIKYAPVIIDLPKTYAEFNTKYFPQKCSLCNEFSKKLSSCICLLCGEVFCLTRCDNNNNSIGNANKHASHFHMGLGIFLKIYDLKKAVVNVPVNTGWEGQNVYVDKLGQGIQTFFNRWDELRQKDFKDFVLSSGFVQYYKEVIARHHQGKEAFQIVQNDATAWTQPGSL